MQCACWYKIGISLRREPNRGREGVKIRGSVKGEKWHGAHGDREGDEEGEKERKGGSGRKKEPMEIEREKEWKGETKREREREREW